MTLFVWDFHGVLEKDNENAVLEISNRILEQLGYKERFTAEDNLKLYGKKWYEYFEYLLPNKPHEEHINLQMKCIALEEKEPNIVDSNIKPNDFALEVLETIAKTENDQILISNMSDVALMRFMDAIDVTKYFPKGKAFPCNSRGADRVFTKNEVLAKYLIGKSYRKIIIIGDTPPDMKLKEVAGGTTYLYTHPHLNFKDSPADHRINDLRNILKEL